MRTDVTTRNGRTSAAERLEQMPPHVDHVEQQLLGSLMLTSTCIGDVAKIVGRDDFRQDRHRQLFEHLSNMPLEVANDITLLTHWLMSVTDLEDIGGSAYLGETMQSVPNARKATHYAEIVRNTAIRRRLREKALHVAALAEDPKADLSIVLEKAELVVEAAKTTPRVNGHVGVVSRTFDQIEVQELRWLWPGKIPLGRYTEIIGYPGVGKSLLTVDLMARVSRGFSCPDSTTLMGPGGVVLMSTEDDPNDTIAPRLIAAEADLQRIRLVDAVGEYDDETGRRSFRSISLDRDIPAVEQAVQNTPDCKLVVIDPIIAYSGKIDSHKAAEVRALLVPITTMAQRRGLAVVGVTHFNKGGNGGPAINRGMGSQAWVAAARMAWGVVKSPDDPTVRLLVPIKANLAADATGLSYKIMDVDGIPRAAWSMDAITYTADDALAAQTNRHQSPKRRDVKAWLLNKLNGGAVPANDILSDGAAEGFSEKLLRWAKKELGVDSYSEGFGADAVWYWNLPNGDR
jgi:hypothetical protein